MKPKILFSGSRSGQKNYEDAISQAGGIPIPGCCPEADLSCDGLLLCGGGDADPSLYGQENCGSRDIDRDRDGAELALIEAFMGAGKPILGICRGHQMVNIALGGTLIQDLPAHLRPFHVREEADKVHPVRAAPGSLFEAAYGPVFAVNSAHHQGLDRLGAGLRPVLWSEGGIVEAVEHESLPILCVQFHPERMSYGLRRPDTVDGAAIFRWLIGRR